MQHHSPILTRHQIHKPLLFFLQNPAIPFLPILPDPITSRILTLARDNLFHLDPLILIAPGLELDVADLIQSRVVEVILELHADELAVVGVLGIRKTVGFDEDVFHEGLRNAWVGHFVLVVIKGWLLLWIVDGMQFICLLFILTQL